VAVVQYTFTHKRYTERHTTNNKYNNTKIRNSAGHAPSVGFTLAFALKLRKKHRKTSERDALEKQKDIFHSKR
jgi:hypothetical protein